MQYETGAEKIAMMGGTNIPAIRPLANDPQVIRARKVLLVILGVCFAFAVTGLIGTVFGFPVDISKDSALAAQYPELVQGVMRAQWIRWGVRFAFGVMALAYYGFGLLVAYQYNETGIRVLAWIGVTLLILVGIGIVVFLLIIIVFTIGLSRADEGNPAYMIGGILVFIVVVIGSLIGSALLIIIVVFSFKLAKSIHANKQATGQHI